MGVQVSKEEFLYQQVSYGNIDGIRALRQQGAGLEWIDKEGKTPLIVACLRHDLLPVAKALIEMGANVNAYRPGSHAGTPLHHAAKKGLEQTVHLLLSSRANPFIMNDDCHTALDLAREKGHVNVVRAIESRISLFSGWLREHYGPGFLEAFAPQLLSRKIWAVVLPCDSRNPTRPLKFELAIYPDLQVAKPRIVISLWKAHIEEPKFNQTDPALFIVVKATGTRYKFLSANEGDKQQLQWFFNACRGISLVSDSIPSTTTGISVPSPSQAISYPSATSTAAPVSNQEDIELATAINASIQTAIAEGVPNVQPSMQTSNTNGWGPSNAASSTNKLSSQAPVNEPNTYNGSAVPEVRPTIGAPQLNLQCPATLAPNVQPSTQTSNTNGWGPSNAASSTNKLSSQAPMNEPNTYNGWAVPEVRPTIGAPQPNLQGPATPVVIASSQEVPPPQLAPSAPPIADDTFYDGPILYPLIDSSPVDISVPAIEITPETPDDKEGGSTSGTSKPASNEDKVGNGTSGCCVICLDAPVEGACIPCGHMAGCMSCLREIEAKNWGCPVCRSKIDQVIRLYVV